MKKNLVFPKINQNYVLIEQSQKKNSHVSYQKISGSVVNHLGELHLEKKPGKI